MQNQQVENNEIGIFRDIKWLYRLEAGNSHFISDKNQFNYRLNYIEIVKQISQKIVKTFDMFLLD